jgi:hypothetical protein
MLSDDLERIAAAAASFAAPGERVTGILAAEPLDAGRVYLCAYESADGHAWLALDGDGHPVESKRLVHDAASLAALCEVAEETAGGGELAALRATLAELREREAPEGIEDAEEAALALEQTLQPEPRLATTAYLDALGAAARRLEQALGDASASPFAAALQQALPAVEELAAAVERQYKGPLT